jgi:hypothetical protein
MVEPRAELFHSVYGDEKEPRTGGQTADVVKVLMAALVFKEKSPAKSRNKK